MGVLVYAITWFAAYPRAPAIADENAYLTQALLCRTGHLTYEQSSIPAPQMSVENKGRTASKYPPGTSLFLVPFTLFGWRWVFLSGFLLALAGAWLFRRVLGILAPDAHPSWSLLYLLYPAVVLYSRTIMSDLLAATVVLAAFYFLLRRGRNALWAGVFLGYACLVRYSAAILAPVFLILLILRSEHKLRSAVLLGAGIAPFIVAALLYNAYCYGGPFSFPMHLTGVFSPAFLPVNLSFYMPALLLLYPLMLVGPLLAGRGSRLLLSLPAYALIVPYLFFSYTPARTVVGSVVGLRYLLPAIPFLTLGLALFLHRAEASLKGLRFLRSAAILLMAAASVAVQMRHDSHLAAQDRFRRDVLRTIPDEALVLCNAAVSEFFSVAWGWRDYRHIAEHNVPMMLDKAIAGRDTVCAALITSRSSRAEQAMFEMLPARFPDRETLLDGGSFNGLRVHRLKPARPSR